MTTTPLRAAAALVAFAVAVPLAAAAAPKPFSGPADWEHSVGATPSPQSQRAQESWKKGDGTVSYLEDGSLAYDDILGMVKKNVTTNNLKPAVDRDRTCDGRRAHEIEMTLGTTVVRQIVVDDGPGVTRLTYTRPQGTAPATDVTAALSAYCGANP